MEQEKYIELLKQALTGQSAGQEKLIPGVE